MMDMISAPEAVAPPLKLREIADRLALVQRWNGRTIVPWSVLQHSLLVTTMLPTDATLLDRLYGLLHDCAEIFIGDIPRGYKTQEQSYYEKGLLEHEIYDALGLQFSWATSLSEVDDLAALVEAQCIVSPADRRRVWDSHIETWGTPNTALVENGERTLWDMRDMGRKDSIDLWIKSVEGLIAMHNNEKEE